MQDEARESGGGGAFKCAICGRVIEGRVMFCELCGCPACEDCHRYTEEPYYGCNVFCLDCWAK